MLIQALRKLLTSKEIAKDMKRHEDYIRQVIAGHSNDYLRSKIEKKVVGKIKKLIQKREKED